MFCRLIEKRDPGGAAPAPARECGHLGVVAAFSDDIAIDLGTANTLVHVAGRGVVIDEPSMVAFRSSRTHREVLAVGLKAKQMIGRAPEAIDAIRPLRDGVIADFIATEEMLRQFIKRAKSMFGFRRPRIMICVPAGATPLERRAVKETALSAGARIVFMIEEPVAASIGAGLPIDDATGAMVVDIGGGTTDVAVLSRGEVIESRALRLAGNAMDGAIVRHVRRRHQLLIGEINAERIKIEAGTACALDTGDDTEIHIRGRDVVDGRSKAVVLRPHDVAEALAEPIGDLAEFIRRTIEELPPDIAAGIEKRGIYMTGGGALLDRLDHEFTRRVGIAVHRTEDPLRCVVKGTAMVLETLATREHLLVRV